MFTPPTDNRAAQSRGRLFMLAITRVEAIALRGFVVGDGRAIAYAALG